METIRRAANRLLRLLGLRRTVHYHLHVDATAFDSSVERAKSAVSSLEDLWEQKRSEIS